MSQFQGLDDGNTEMPRSGCCCFLGAAPRRRASIAPAATRVSLPIHADCTPSASGSAQPALEPCDGLLADVGREVVVAGIPDVADAVRRPEGAIDLAHRGAVLLFHGSALADRLADRE